MHSSEVKFINTEYPDILREISTSPKQLYLAGELPKEPAIAIVGTRRPTEYGRRVTYQLAGELARAGLVIVSGLAYGIDGVAHRAALEAGGKTVAVLAGGLDKIYPTGHQALAQQIIENDGALVSEYPSGTESFKYNFPARNRIISGLSQAVIVTEADASSGSLITASHALNQNRTVMAVPGNITSLRSAGPNNLIRTGAIPVTSSNDVLAALELERCGFTASAQPKSREEALILELLSQGLSRTDELIDQSQLSASQFANIITLMEITGKVRNLGAGNWVAR